MEIPFDYIFQLLILQEFVKKICGKYICNWLVVSHEITALKNFNDNTLLHYLAKKIFIDYVS